MVLRVWGTLVLTAEIALLLIPMSAPSSIIQVMSFGKDSESYEKTLRIRPDYLFAHLDAAGLVIPWW